MIAAIPDMECNEVKVPKCKITNKIEMAQGVGHPDGTTPFLSGLDCGSGGRIISLSPPSWANLQDLKGEIIHKPMDFFHLYFALCLVMLRKHNWLTGYLRLPISHRCKVGDMHPC